MPKLVAEGRSFCREVEPGLRFQGNTKDLLALEVYLFGSRGWQPNLTAFLQRRLAPGDVFVDVGANHGWFTMHASRLVGNTGSVVAVEASPILADRLRANIQVNNLRNVRVVVAAAWSGPGELTLEHGPIEQTGITRVTSRESSSGDTRVRCDALCNLLTDDEVARCRLVKMDVEGAEFEIIAGLAGDLERFADHAEFVVAVHPSNASSPDSLDALMSIFANAGFAAYELPHSYAFRHFLLDTVPSSLHRLDDRPIEETDIVFSRQGDGVLDL